MKMGEYLYVIDAGSKACSFYWEDDVWKMDYYNDKRVCVCVCVCFLNAEILEHSKCTLIPWYISVFLFLPRAKKSLTPINQWPMKTSHVPFMPAKDFQNSAATRNKQNSGCWTPVKWLTQIILIEKKQGLCLKTNGSTCESGPFFIGCHWTLFLEWCLKSGCC